MSTNTTTLLELDDDPLGGPLLKSGAPFGVRAAALAENAPDPTDSGDWPGALHCGNSCSITFRPLEPDQTLWSGIDG